MFENNNATAISKKLTANSNSNLGNAFDAVLLSKYLPASVIINYDMEILEFRGTTEPYLKNNSGKASLNILKMARPEISFELRNAIHHAIKTKHTVRKMGIEINPDKNATSMRIVNLEVAPFKIENEESLLIIVFTGQLMEIQEPSIAGGKGTSVAKDRRIQKLEEELVAARADMEGISHDQEAANEELQSANEEIISSNEELQSLNEELETSKEEIESTNEELTSSNQEMQIRIQEVEELLTYNEAIFSTIHEPMLILDKDIRIKSANKSFYKAFHVTEEDSIGASLYKIGNNQWNIPSLRNLLEDIVPKNIRFQDFEVEHTFPAIGHKIMLLNGHRVILKSKNEELIVLTIIDITEVRRLAIEQIQNEEKEKREEALIISNKKLAFLIKEKEQHAEDLVIANFELAFQIKEKEQRLKELEEMKAYSKSIEIATEIAEDSKNKAESERQKAEDSVKTKQEFLSTMSHEIRTPITAILGYSRLLKNSNVSMVHSKYINYILAAGENLLNIVNDILDLSKIESGSLTEYETEFNLAETINMVLNLHKLKADEKKINLLASIDTNIPIIIKGDALRLNQVLINLVNNATKFTKKGEVEIAANLIKEKGKNLSVEFIVRDTGIGIPKDKFSVIFESFKQANMDSSRKYGGTGLGLTISKQLVEFMGGTINVKSEENKGTKFYFTLNFKKYIYEKSDIKIINTPIEIPAADLSSTTILLVEDNTVNRDLFKEIIEIWGFKVDTAHNGKIAIEKIKGKNYDLVLMDIQMPEMDGYEATKYVRTVLLKTEMPVIAMTAHAFSGEEDKCIEAGMNDYISKPFLPTKLYTKIMSALPKQT